MSPIRGRIRRTELLAALFPPRARKRPVQPPPAASSPAPPVPGPRRRAAEPSVSRELTRDDVLALPWFRDLPAEASGLCHGHVDAI
jgi:hypothetical protein